MPQTIDYSIRPNYVEYEGQFYHIPEFLSLQEGKVYRPATSRLARWMESARNDFYEQVERLFAPQRVETGTYLSDIVALWLPLEGLHVGLVIRIVRPPSLKSNFPVFEWRSDSQKSEKVTISFRVLNFLKEDSVAWKLQTTNNFHWCHVRSILKGVGKVSITQRVWPVNVDLRDILKDLPRLHLMDKERERKEEIEKREERKRMKEGNPECMTVQLLKEVLEEMGEPYSKSLKKKTQLIQRVRAAREKQFYSVSYFLGNHHGKYCKSTKHRTQWKLF